MTAHTARDGEAAYKPARVVMLEALIKALASGATPHGSESFQRVRDQLNPQHRALLMEVLGG